MPVMQVVLAPSSPDHSAEVRADDSPPLPSPLPQPAPPISEPAMMGQEPYFSGSLAAEILAAKRAEPPIAAYVRSHMPADGQPTYDWANMDAGLRVHLARQAWKQRVGPPLDLTY